MSKGFSYSIPQMTGRLLRIAAPVKGTLAVSTLASILGNLAQMGIMGFGALLLLRCAGWVEGSLWVFAGLMALSALLIRLKGSKARSGLMDSLSVGRYNGQFKPARTGADWISRDTAVVDAYCADPLCRFLPTVGMYHDMMVGLQLLAKPANLRRMDPDTPVYFFSGDRDPVGANGAGVRKVAGWFKDAGVRDLTVKLYPEGRHEMLNETNRQEVWDDVLSWLEKHL